jgi:hypothetical protein
MCKRPVSATQGKEGEERERFTWVSLAFSLGVPASERK